MLTGTLAIAGLLVKDRAGLYCFTEPYAQSGAIDQLESRNRGKVLVQLSLLAQAQFQDERYASVVVRVLGNAEVVCICNLEFAITETAEKLLALVQGVAVSCQRDGRSFTGTGFSPGEVPGCVAVESVEAAAEDSLSAKGRDAANPDVLTNVAAALGGDQEL